MRGKLSPALRASKGVFLAVGLFSFFINALMLTVPMYMLQIYDRVLTSRSIDTLVMLSAAAVGLMIVMGLLELARSHTLVRLSIRLDRWLGPDVFSSILASRLWSPDDQPGNPLRDLGTLRNFLTGNGLFAFFDSPWTPAFIILIYLLHPLLGFIALVGAILLFCLALVGELVTRRQLREAAQASTEAHGFAEATLRNAEAIEAMGMLAGVRSRWRMLHEEGLTHQATASDRAGIVSAFAKFMRPVLQIAMLGAGAYLAVYGLITPGVMIAASIILGRALAPVEAAIGGWRGFVEARSAYARLKHALDDSAWPVPGTQLPAPNGLLRVEGLAGAAPGQVRPFLRGITFALDGGESLAIIGPSAAGKSMLARMLVGVWRPLSGHVRLDGVDLAQWHSEERGPHVGYLPQDVELLCGTVAENIARFGAPDSRLIVAAARKAGIHELILKLPQGYDTVIEGRGHQLSGGQRQRIGLARAVYGDPVLIVLDEPGANLDSQGDEALASAIRAMRDAGQIVVIISHRPATLATVDKIIVLAEGRVEMLGPRTEVLARFVRPRPPSAHLVSVQKVER